MSDPDIAVVRAALTGCVVRGGTDPTQEAALAALDRLEAELAAENDRIHLLCEQRQEAWGRAEEAEAAYDELVRTGLADLTETARKLDAAEASVTELEAEVARLREALFEIEQLHRDGHADCFSDAADDYANIARAALAGKDTDA